MIQMIVLTAVKKDSSPNKNLAKVDDVVEIKHYQQTSWAGLVISSFAGIFYAPLYLASIPLISYDAFYLLKTIIRSESYQRNPIMTLF